MAAFEKARKVGADGIELDVRLCADGVPVVVHDATVDATTDGSGRVADMTLAQLRHVDAGSSFSPAFAGERIPTLAQVLEVWGGKMLLNVELKGVTPFDCGLERAVVDLIEKAKLGRQAWTASPELTLSPVLLSSFNPFALRRVQRINPHIPTGLLYSRRPWLSQHLARAIMPRPSEALHPHHSIVDGQQVDRARSHRKRLHTWTVDDPTEMRRLISLRVDGIITNAPDLLQQVLETAL
jgi:glycerophosphoryl diester phosphodiesterase